MSEQAMAQAIVFGQSSSVTLPDALVRQLGLQAGDLLLTVSAPGGGILVRRIDGAALIAWLRSCNVKVSIPPDEMLLNLRRIGFGATMVDGRVSYEGGVLDEWTNRFPAVHDGELVIEATSGLHNASDVLHFLLQAVIGTTPPSGYTGIGFQYAGWVDDLAKHMVVGE